jgi:hypothetical protein
MLRVMLGNRKMSYYHLKLNGKMKISAAILVSLLVLVALSIPRAAALDSLSIVTNSDLYNLGDPISVAVAGPSTTTGSVTLFDASNRTIAQRQVQISGGDSSVFVEIYTLNVTDQPGTWRATVFDSSSNESSETTFEVVPIWDRILALDDRVTDLQAKLSTQNDTINSLQGSIDDLSSRMSAAGLSSSVAYLAVAISILSVILTIANMRKKAGFIPKKRGR